MFYNTPFWILCVSSLPQALCLQEAPGKSLHDYLSLPVEDYNTLDPKVVQSLGENRFKLTPPFNDWFKINIQPEVILRIQPEPAQSRVFH